MEKNSKRTVNSILFSLTSLVYFFLAYVGFQKQNIDLVEYETITSEVVDKGVDFRYDSKGKSECFYIQLRDVNRKLGVYRMTKNYDDLLSIFEIGDTVTAYYRSNNNDHEKINIDLVQVEKEGNILLDKKEYERKESLLIYIGTFFGVLTLLLSYLYYKRKILTNST